MTRLLLIHAGFYMQQMNWDLTTLKMACRTITKQVKELHASRKKRTASGKVHSCHWLPESRFRWNNIFELCITTLIMVYSHFPTIRPIQRPIKMGWIDCVFILRRAKTSTRDSQNILRCERTISILQFYVNVVCSASVLWQIFETAMILHSQANWITPLSWLWKQWGRNSFYRLFRCK